MEGLRTLRKYCCLGLVPLILVEALCLEVNFVLVLPPSLLELLIRLLGHADIPELLLLLKMESFPSRLFWFPDSACLPHELIIRDLTIAIRRGNFLLLKEVRASVLLSSRHFKLRLVGRRSVGGRSMLMQEDF
jgi:hypothetical protein